MTTLGYIEQEAAIKTAMEHLSMPNEYSVFRGIYDGLLVESYKPSEEEIIVVRYDCGEFPYSKAYELYKGLVEMLSNNKVILLPYNIPLKLLAKQQLNDLINDLTETLEELLRGEED